MEPIIPNVQGENVSFASTCYEVPLISEQPEFQSVLRQARDQVREGLLLTEQIMNQVASEAPGQLKARLEKILSRRGKRVRAVMLFLVAETCGKPTPEQLRRQAYVAASLEMLHLASLVHDDVIDESVMRRGIQTAHQEWGNKMAVLMGDFILSKSMELGVADSDPRIPCILSAASSQLVAGEVMELDLAGRLDASQQDYFDVIEGKTASLFDACARCGAILSGLQDSLVKDCGVMGRHFGITFQIIDDLLDYGVGASNLGKAKFVDLANGLTTLPLLIYFHQANPQETHSMKDLLNRAAVADESAIVELVQRLSQSGSFDRAMEMAVSRIAESMSILQKLPEGEARTLLGGICQSVSNRHA